MVPIQFFLLTSLGVDPTTAIRVAFGTSLAVILPTAISGALGHARRGVVLYRPMILMGISGLFAALIGGTVAANTPGIYLKIMFGYISSYIRHMDVNCQDILKISGEPKKRDL